MGLVLAVLAFAITYFAGRRSFWAGLAATLGVGFAYGILRARFSDGFSHFIFDAAVLALFLTVLTGPPWMRGARRLRGLRQWVLVLVAWACFMLLLPLQDPLIQLVGLRGNAFLLPFLLLGAMMRPEETGKLALALAVFNLGAFGFAVAEYYLGIERFFPYNAVTDIIYRSNDLLDYRAYRIPSTFSSSHAYAGTMVMTLPFLIGAWVQRPERREHTWLLAAGTFAALTGVFMAAARSHALVLFVLLIVASFSTRLRGGARFGWVLILAAVIWLVSGEERLQRFTTLGDTEYVTQRIAGSINKTFIDLAYEYPLGNGLGGGGTSVPYFLERRLRNPVAMESEYARILLEQGLPGLVLWVAFLLWAFLSRTTPRGHPWYLGRSLAWAASASYFAIGLIGVGLLTSVPQTCLLLLATGWIAAPPAPDAAPAPSPVRARSSPSRDLAGEPA